MTATPGCVLQPKQNSKINEHQTFAFNLSFLAHHGCPPPPQHGLTKASIHHSLTNSKSCQQTILAELQAN
jgi:hypothetical protein